MTGHRVVDKKEFQKLLGSKSTTGAAERTVPASECEQYSLTCHTCGKRTSAFRESRAGRSRTWCDAACREKDPG